MFICGPSVFLGWRLIYYWWGSLGSDSAHWHFLTVLPTAIMLLFFCITLFFGADAVIDFYSISNGTYMIHRKFAAIFILPGIGFGIASFPKQGAELVSSYFFKLAKIGALNWFAIYGWMLIFLWLYITAIALTF